MKKLFFGLTIILSISAFASNDVLPVKNASSLNNFMLENSKNDTETKCEVETKVTSTDGYYTRDCYYVLGVQVYCTEWVFHPYGPGPRSVRPVGST